MATSTGIPPRPKKAPTVHLKGASRKEPRTLKSDLRKLKEKASTAREKWAEGRKASAEKTESVRKEAAEILAPAKEKVSEEKKLAGEVMKPVYKAIEVVKTGLSPENGKTRPYVTSFLFSSVLCWVGGPQILVALYDRAVLLTGRTLVAPARDAATLAAGEGAEWGILHGPGRWFRDTVGMAYETGRMGSLIWAAILGLMPMIILGIRNMSVNHLAQSTYQGRMSALTIRWMTRAAYLVPVLFFVGVSYPEQVTWMFGEPWTLEWWQIWVAALFCTAYYFTMWVFDRIERLHRSMAEMSEEEKEKARALGPGLFHVILVTPLASIVTGALLYAPGAAW